MGFYCLFIWAVSSQNWTCLKKIPTHCTLGCQNSSHPSIIKDYQIRMYLGPAYSCQLHQNSCDFKTQFYNPQHSYSCSFQNCCFNKSRFLARRILNIILEVRSLNLKLILQMMNSRRFKFSIRHTNGTSWCTKRRHKGSRLYHVNAFYIYEALLQQNHARQQLEVLQRGSGTAWFLNIQLAFKNDYLLSGNVGWWGVYTAHIGDGCSHLDS